MSPTVGKNVDGWCTRCKLVLAHTIEVVTDGKIARVHCNTCGGRHAHRPREPHATKSATRGGRVRERPRAVPDKPSDEYRALLRGRGEGASRPYSTTTRFAVGEVVSHAAFGIGVVMAERDSTKIDVVFADGPMVLLHGR